VIKAIFAGDTYMPFEKNEQGDTTDE